MSYSSDVDKVTALLLEAANAHPDVLETPHARVQFDGFGDSSLDFILHIFSHDFWRIEMIKSEIRYSITRLFRQNDVEIPFPQQDIWVRSKEINIKNMGT